MGRGSNQQPASGATLLFGLRSAHASQNANEEDFLSPSPNRRTRYQAQHLLARFTEGQPQPLLKLFNAHHDQLGQQSTSAFSHLVDKTVRQIINNRYPDLPVAEQPKMVKAGRDSLAQLAQRQSLSATMLDQLFCEGPLLDQEDFGEVGESTVSFATSRITESLKRNRPDRWIELGLLPYYQARLADQLDRPREQQLAERPAAKCLLLNMATRLSAGQNKVWEPWQIRGQSAGGNVVRSEKWPKSSSHAHAFFRSLGSPWISPQENDLLQRRAENRFREQLPALLVAGNALPSLAEAARQQVGAACVETALDRLADGPLTNERWMTMLASYSEDVQVTSWINSGQLPAEDLAVGLRAYHAPLGDDDRPGLGHARARMARALEVHLQNIFARQAGSAV